MRMAVIGERKIFVVGFGFLIEIPKRVKSVHAEAVPVGPIHLDSVTSNRLPTQEANKVDMIGCGLYVGAVSTATTSAGTFTPQMQKLVSTAFFVVPLDRQITIIEGDGFRRG